MIRERLAKGVTVYLGDCREVLSGLSIEADAVVTDPPYGDSPSWSGGTNYGWSDREGYREMQSSWDAEPIPIKFILQLCKFDEAIIWGGNYYLLPPARGWLVWNKPRQGMTFGDAELAWTNLDTPIRALACDN